MTNERTRFRSERLREEYTKIKHKSGLDIYVFPKKLTTTYAIFATRYGSVDTRFKLAGDEKFVTVPDGVAHFLEHKMFENADGIDSFERFSEFGADANAYTSHHRTAYLFSCTENFTESLTELLTYVKAPYFTDETVQKEQGIIGQEIRMCDDRAGNARYYNLLSALFHGKQIWTNICGTVESIAEITPEILYSCHRVFYNLSNMALVVCGDVSVDEVLAVADATLPIEQPVEIVRGETPEPTSIVRDRITCEMPIAQPIFTIGIKDNPGDLSPEDRIRRSFAFSILLDVLCNKSSDLYHQLYTDDLITGGLGYGYEGTPTYAYIGISGESRDPEAVFAVIKKTIAEAAANGISETAFRRTKRVMYADLVRNFDATADIADLMLDYLFEDIEPLSIVDLLEAVTPEEVEALLREAFDDEYWAMSIVRPRKEVE